MNERKSHDFITVDSFSQLPFIVRQMKPPPPPPPPNPPNIRLFGFNFPSTATDHPPIATAAAACVTTDNGRKFECHYCCRNFPTSQALGGHQNAHKRERQKAKRAHMYDLVGYHRIGLPVAATSRFPFSQQAAQFYPSWNVTAPPAGLGSTTQPILGSPLPDMWRIPAATAAGGEVGFSGTDSSSSSSTSPRKESVYELKDGVSLDLHL